MGASRTPPGSWTAPGCGTPMTRLRGERSSLALRIQGRAEGEKGARAGPGGIEVVAEDFMIRVGRTRSSGSVVPRSVRPPGRRERGHGPLRTARGRRTRTAARSAAGGRLACARRTGAAADGQLGAPANASTVTARDRLLRRRAACSRKARRSARKDIYPKPKPEPCGRRPDGQRSLPRRRPVPSRTIHHGCGAATAGRDARADNTWPAWCYVRSA